MTPKDEALLINYYREICQAWIKAGNPDWPRMVECINCGYIFVTIPQPPHLLCPSCQPDDYIKVSNNE